MPRLDATASNTMQPERSDALIRGSIPVGANEPTNLRKKLGGGANQRAEHEIAEVEIDVEEEYAVHTHNVSDEQTPRVELTDEQRARLLSHFSTSTLLGGDNRIPGVKTFSTADVDTTEENATPQQARNFRSEERMTDVALTSDAIDKVMTPAMEKKYGRIVGSDVKAWFAKWERVANNGWERMEHKNKSSEKSSSKTAAHRHRDSMLREKLTALEDVLHEYTSLSTEREKWADGQTFTEVVEVPSNAHRDERLKQERLNLLLTSGWAGPKTLMEARDSNVVTLRKSIMMLPAVRGSLETRLIADVAPRMTLKAHSSEGDMMSRPAFDDMPGRFMIVHSLYKVNLKAGNNKYAHFGHQARVVQCLVAAIMEFSRHGYIKRRPSGLAYGKHYYQLVGTNWKKRGVCRTIVEDDEEWEEVITPSYPVYSDYDTSGLQCIMTAGLSQVNRIMHHIRRHCPEAYAHVKRAGYYIWSDTDSFERSDGLAGKALAELATLVPSYVFNDILVTTSLAYWRAYSGRDEQPQYYGEVDIHLCGQNPTDSVTLKQLATYPPMALATVKSVIAGSVLTRCLYEAVTVRSNSGGCRLADWFKYHRAAGMNEPSSTYKLHHTVRYLVHEQTTEALRDWDDTLLPEIEVELHINHPSATIVRHRVIDECMMELAPSILSPRGRQAASVLTIKEGRAKLVTRYRELPAEYTTGILASGRIDAKGLYEHEVSMVDATALHGIATWLALDRCTALEEMLEHSVLVLASTLKAGTGNYEYSGYGVRSDKHYEKYVAMIQGYKEQQDSECNIALLQNHERMKVKRTAMMISAAAKSYRQDATNIVLVNELGEFAAEKVNLMAMCVHARSIKLGQCEEFTAFNGKKFKVASTASQEEGAILSNILALVLSNENQIKLPNPKKPRSNSDFKEVSWSDLVQSRVHEMRVKSPYLRKKFNGEDPWIYWQEKAAMCHGEELDRHYNLAAVILMMRGTLIDECLARRMASCPGGVRFVKNPQTTVLNGHGMIKGDTGAALELSLYRIEALANGQSCSGCGYCLDGFGYSGVKNQSESPMRSVPSAAVVWRMLLPYMQSPVKEHSIYLEHFGISKHVTAGYGPKMEDTPDCAFDTLHVAVGAAAHTKPRRAVPQLSSEE